MKSLEKIFFITFILGAVLAAAFQFALAQAQPAAEGITISPPLNEITLKPGDVTEQKIQITNPTTNVIELYPSVMNFQSSGDGGEPKFYSASDESNKFSLAQWISFGQTKLALTPQQVANFSYTITVPQDAEPGGHYGVVFLATQPPASDKQASQVSIASMVGSLVLVRVPGNIVEKGNLDEFSAPRFYFKPPVPFTVFFSNQGNIHYKPEGEITIRNWRGREIDKIDINPTKGNILPDSRRKFALSWKDSKEPFWQIPVGRFSANLHVVYGANGNVIDGKVYFWIIPWWVIIAAFLFLVLVIFFLIKIIRRRKKGGKPPTAFQNSQYRRSPYDPPRPPSRQI